MSTKSWRLGMAIMLAVGGTWVSAPVTAQSPARGAEAGDAGANPINCWWKTDKSAVRIGEPFGLTLTCRVMETDRVAVVPNVSDIEPTSIQLTPFDVVGGTRQEDIVTPPWRYLEYVYSVRLLGEEFFGRDIAIPSTNVTFRIRTRGSDAVEGREHTYVLPSMPMRILSLLPAQAADIRDPSVDTFGDIEARRFRATMELVAAAVSFGFAAVLLIIAAVRALERFRRRGPVVEPTMATRTVLGGCLREVDRVRAEAAREGWTPGLAARALASFRVAGAIALSQPITQKFVTGDTPIREGQLALGHGMLRRRRALVSAPITADAIDRLRTAGNGNSAPGVAGDVLDQIRAALAGLNAVRYGRNGGIDAQQLDLMLDQGSRALRRLRVARLWPARAARALAKSAPIFDLGAWRH
ncbi:MAG TPA: hypothetical protein VIX63_15565 [Vicinamibacterales bacterium]